MQTTLALDQPNQQQPINEARRARVIDTAVEIVTPENIAFKYQVAGPFRRLSAFLIDIAVIIGGLILLWFLLMIFLLLVGMLLTWIIGPGVVQDFLQVVSVVLIGAYIVLWFVSFWFYGGLFETYWSGQTPGKWLMGVRAVSANGEPIAGWQAILRNILRLVDSLPLLSPAIFAGTFIGDALESIVFSGSATETWTLESLSHYTVIPVFMLGLACMTTNRRFQRIGDLVCGTMVVLEERSWLLGVSRLEDPRAPQLAALLPPKFLVTRSMASALATYVERRNSFSPARRREIARHLGEPLLEQFGMPPDTSHDLLLCALYYRTFVTDRNGGGEPPAVARPKSSDPTVASVVREVAKGPLASSNAPPPASATGPS